MESEFNPRVIAVNVRRTANGKERTVIPLHVGARIQLSQYQADPNTGREASPAEVLTVLDRDTIQHTHYLLGDEEPISEIFQADEINHKVFEQNDPSDNTVVHIMYADPAYIRNRQS